MADANREWEANALDHVLMALASWPALRQGLVFKGARILNRLLSTPTGRQSYDIDSNLQPSVVQAHAAPEDQQSFLKDEIDKAVDRYFDRMSPRYDLAQISIRRIPQGESPFGWYLFRVSLKVTDAKRRGVKGLPLLALDVASPEPLSEHAVAEIDVNGQTVSACTLSRIAGEKLRAYLSSLPTYCDKVRKTDHTVIRHNDLYDLTKIVREKQPIAGGFWSLAAEDFRLACRARLVDCVGPLSFREAWDHAKYLYETDISLEDVPFREAEASLERIVTVFEEIGVFPLTFPMPGA